MDKLFKNNKVSCLYDNNCKNKSSICCRECSRNLNRIVRDWFKPTDECVKNLEKTFEGHKCNILSFKEDKIEEYKLKNTQMPENKKDS